ncbi:MAG: DUF1146 domain-containing protein [Alicyclobacillus sp.]|nr:DUF1146 domain-containing protein [Alicyclobacillus sp.]
MGNGVTDAITAHAAMIAADGFIFIVGFLVGTYYAWRALGILRWDKFVMDPFGPQARLLRFLVAMVGGFIVGLIAVAYLLAGQALRMLFG